MLGGCTRNPRHDGECDSRVCGRRERLHGHQHALLSVAATPPTLSSHLKQPTWDFAIRLTSTRDGLTRVSQSLTDILKLHSGIY